MRSSIVASLALIVAAPLALAACSSGGSHNGQPDGMTNNAPQCSDGLDNDGDGKIDFPNDPGCLNPNQNSELDDCPTGPNCPQCANGKDDDGDGKIDYPADPGCSSASDPTEKEVNLGACGPDVTVLPWPSTNKATGTIQLAASHLISTCGGLGAETAYQIDVAAPTTLVATTTQGATTADTVLYLRGATCTDMASEITCNDNASTSTTGSTITADLAPGTYYLIVDGASSTVGGAYEIDATFYPGQGQACDPAATPPACAPGYYCRPAPGQTAPTCQPPRCKDGADNDSDGKTDFPNDPGCDSPTDDDETDDCPSGPNCPQCANGKDDDGDGKIDYGTASTNDPGCLSASQPVEGCGTEQDPMQIQTTAVLTGNTTGYHDDFSPSCGGTGGLDAVVFVQLPKLDSLTMTTVGTSWDTVLELLPSTCGGTALACNDESPSASLVSEIDLTNVPAGFYAAVVDGYDSTYFGPFTLNVSGVISAGGRCDVPLFASGALTCGSGTTCDGTICKGTAACDNGVDDDMDGKKDYPDDPGCTSPTDTDETDDCPTGPNCPACANGKDDDGDGQTDYPADTTCKAASGTSEACSTTDPIATLAKGSTAGDTTGLASDFTPSCVFSAGAPDAVYQVDLPAMTSFHVGIDVGTASWYPYLELLDATCGGTNLGCDHTAIDLSGSAAGRYYLVVSGDTSSDFGPYTLTTTGTIANGGSCEGALAQAGAITCASGYACKGTTGSRTCQLAACNDGVDNDHDNKTDFPNDPGCTSPSDDDETDDCPNGPNCPACSNGKDDDADGLKDYPADFGCSSAAGTTEVFCATDQDKPAVIGTPTTSGTTVGAHDDFQPDCVTGSTAPDKVYALVLPVAVDTLTIDTNNSPFDTVLYVSDNTCGPPDKACDDNSGAGTVGDSLITMTSVAPGAYSVVVDGAGTAAGAYLLHVNGIVAPGATCTSSLFVTGVLTCPAGQSCKSGKCQ